MVTNRSTTLEVPKEPLVDKESSLRADLAATFGTSRYYFDIQIVAISKNSAGKTLIALLQRLQRKICKSL
jgi:hypothetical protein